MTWRGRGAESQSDFDRRLVRFATKFLQTPRGKATIKVFVKPTVAEDFAAEWRAPEPWLKSEPEPANEE